MNKSDFILDPMTETVRQFVENKRDEIQNDFQSIHKQLFQPIIKIPKGNIKRTLASAALEEIINLTENKLSIACQKQSIDWWLATVRRLPLLLKNWPQEWIGYATLAILKYSNWAEDSTGNSEWIGPASVVNFNCGETQLLESCRIASLARVYAEANNLIRWLGKGANVKHKGGGVLQLWKKKNVEKAVADYERRRPEAALFAEEGVFMRPGVLAVEDFLAVPLIKPAVPKPPLDSAILKKTGEIFPITYYFLPLNYHELLPTLCSYDEAIKDIFNITAEQILAVLVSFSKLILFTCPAPDDDFYFSFDKTLEDVAFANRFSFMLQFCRKGYVRFPEDYLLKSLAKEITIGEGKNIKVNIDAFFEAFCLTDEMRQNIDIRTLRPFYLIYKSPGGQCYFDWFWTEDFLRWVIVEGKEWFSSQHGDVFTLRVKTYLETTVPSLKPIMWKQKFFDGMGNTREVDLLIRKNNITLAVECKAYAKNRAHWIGRREAIIARSGRIREAVTQAKDAAQCVQAAINLNDERLSEGTKVEWAVCLPTQEYLMPLEKFGMLQNGIPQVCTPTELAEYFSML